MLRDGDVDSAIALYSEALEADPTIVSCYANRSVCYSKIGLTEKCVKDLTSALVILHSDPPDDTSAVTATGGMVGLIVKFLLRRGAAFHSLGHEQEALEDYEDARQEAIAAATGSKKDVHCFLPPSLKLSDIDATISKFKQHL